MIRLSTLRRRVDVVVITCGKGKLDTSTPVAAQDLYTGGYFKAQLALARALGKPFFILSSKYGLLDPLDRVSTYETTWDAKTYGSTAALSEEGRQAVSFQVAKRLQGQRVLTTCGKAYAGYLPDTWLVFSELIKPLAGKPLNMFILIDAMYTLARTGAYK